jgi:serine/threonine-protein kinase HipA
MPLEFQVDEVLPDGSSDRRVPAFLHDLVPQGRGRQFLVGLLRIADHDRLIMPLLMHGAFNPIGRLRIASAVDFYREQASRNPDESAREGFDLRDIREKSEGFLHHLALHAMLAAGTTGVQGVAPKFLLAQDADERWFADLALDDSRVKAHWLVKLPRGRTEEDLLVHRHEAAYLRLAQACGIRVHDEPRLVGQMLFVRRFDRVVDDRGVHRLHQESLASLAGLRGFGVPTSQNELLAALRRHVTHPFEETVEFIRRDVLNLALRNTDNHARNTAVQRLQDGSVRLTPLFDFGPMFLDPEVVPRSVHWRDRDGVRQDRWVDVIDILSIPDEEKAALASALKAFASTVERLPDLARDCGVEDRVIKQCLPAVEAQARDLAALPAAASKPVRAVGKRRRG